MPWQMFPANAIVGGAFAAAGLGLTALDWLFGSKTRRLGNTYDCSMDVRDRGITEVQKFYNGKVPHIEGSDVFTKTDGDYSSFVNKFPKTVSPNPYLKKVAKLNE